MKLNLQRIILLLTVLFSLAASPLHSQNLTGIWRGYFITESSDQYKFELQIEQKKNFISGVSYSYLTTIFYGKATLTGNFSTNSQNALIQEIKTVEVRMGPGSSACIMKCSFQYVQSGKEEFLEGTFTSKFEKNTYGAKKGDNCGSGKVYLRKVQSSDFYIEPFLRKQLGDGPTGKTDSSKTVKRISPPVVKKTTTPKNTPGTTKKPVPKPTTKNNNSTAKTDGNRGTAKPKLKPDNSPVKVIDDSTNRRKTDNPIIVKKHDLPTPQVMKLRENSLVQTITSDAKTVVVRIYDNGEIDGDTISVYLDKKLVLSKQRLTASPLVVNIRMDDDDAEHEIVMVADNLGRIPPNTSLMLVTAGDKRFEVRITSTEQKNAVVRFVYRKSD